jgi:hypothetical protein
MGIDGTLLGPEATHVVWCFWIRVSQVFAWTKPLPVSGCCCWVVGVGGSCGGCLVGV